MTKRQKDPLRPLADEEREYLERVSRSGSAPASHVARAKAILAVADGDSYTEAAWRAGRRSGDAVSNLDSRFNQEGIEAIEPRHGGGPQVVYGERERERILKEIRRPPGSGGGGGRRGRIVWRSCLRRTSWLPVASGGAGRWAGRGAATVLAPDGSRLWSSV
jgi:transposase